MFLFFSFYLNKQTDSKIKMISLSNIYEQMMQEKTKPAVYEQVWDDWIWGSNCIDPVIESCGDMNYMHVLGLLIALVEALEWKEDKKTIQDLLPMVPLVHLYSKPIQCFTLRELTTQLECLQLSWGCVLSHSDLDHVSDTLKRLMGRLGELAHHAYQQSDGVLDDPQYITSIPHNNNQTVLYITTRKYIRQMICILLVLFRYFFQLFSVNCFRLYYYWQGFAHCKRGSRGSRNTR